MGAKPRWIVPNRVYEITVRTVDRCFLFTPNHNKKDPLLDAASSPRSLKPGNDLIPTSSIINIIGAATGRALANYSIQIHAIECNSNHIHIVFSVTEEQLDHVVPFFRQLLSAIARKVNCVWDREGTVFCRSRMHPCLDDESATQKVLYAMTNPAKDNLIEKSANSPFFTTYHHQAKGRPLKYWYIDYNAYHTAGGQRKKSHKIKDYFRWVTWHTTPLPAQKEMTDSQSQTFFRKQVRTLESKFAQDRKENGKLVMGFRKLKKTDPRDRPKDPKTSSEEPLCHCCDDEARQEYKQSWREFMDQFIPASADYRDGMTQREFPNGSFKPPIFDVASAREP